jgi:hypothetical protein
MNVAQLVETLDGIDVELSVTDKGRLKIVSKQEFISTPEFEQLKIHKDKVVNHLNHKQAELLVCSLKLHDDRVFIRQQLIGVYGSDRLAIVREYLNQWQLGSNSEPASHKKENVGRYRANVWLRERDNAKS